MCDCEALDCRAWDVKTTDGQQKLEFIASKKVILAAFGELSEGLFASVCAKVHVYECVVSVVCAVVVCVCVCQGSRSTTKTYLLAFICFMTPMACIATSSKRVRSFACLMLAVLLMFCYVAVLL